LIVLRAYCFVVFMQRFEVPDLILETLDVFLFALAEGAL